MTPKLCLGTAQFGLSYGITNSAGQVQQSEVSEILNHAQQMEICCLDTAQAYGTAEAVIGENMPKTQGFQIISKLSIQHQTQYSSRDIDIWEQAFNESCKRLRVHNLDALLLHAPNDLFKPGAHHLKAWLDGLRKRKLVKRIGISIYSAQDLDGVDPALLDLVQLPLSLLDQRLLENGTLARLRANGTSIHARSLFLQGLLLTPSSKWPIWVSHHVRAHQQALEQLAEQRGCRLIDMALGFARAQSDLECVVLGVCNVQELKDLHKAWSAESPWRGSEWHDWALQDANILDPRNWPN